MSNKKIDLEKCLFKEIESMRCPKADKVKKPYSSISRRAGKFIDSIPPLCYLPHLGLSQCILTYLLEMNG